MSIGSAVRLRLAGAAGERLDDPRARSAGELRPARLRDWRRRLSQRRDNHTCEKTFECDGGWRPEWILGLNVEERRGRGGAGQRRRDRADGG